MAQAIPIITTAASVIGAGATLMNAFQKPDIPKAPKPLEMEDTAKTAEARRKAQLMAQQRGGRQSTILTSSDDRDTFGGA